MNPIEKDIKFFYDVDDETDSLEHYGTKRHSGRYPWGSGENPYQRSGDFLSRVEELEKSGKFTEKELVAQINATLPEEYRMSTTEFRYARKVAANQRRALQYDQVRALREDGFGWVEIGNKLGISESSVRSIYKGNAGKKETDTKALVETLKKEVDKKGMVDVSEGVNQVLGVSPDKLDEAIYRLEAEYGYQRYGVGIRQPTNINQQTNVMVIAKPEYNQKYAYEHQGDIQSLGDYHSDDGGETFQKLQRPSSMSSDRVAIRYGDEGGLDKDGVIEIRRGVDDLSLGNSHYAQVRIMVDNSHYLKGMAVYSDDVPDGYDVIFNTNKPSGTPKMKVLKPIKDDPDNPFGAALTAAGQSEYIGADGQKHLSPINKLREEGEWDTMAKNLSSQFLSKQPIKLIKQQLNLTLADRKAEYEEIMQCTNPTIKQKLLMDFADTCEGNSMTLKASSFPGQSTKVILPLTKISEKECYCPTYENGTQLALIRYPHAGTFEIPIVTVNNKNVSGKRNFGNIQDAIGINSKVAERLSGADFDGDTVVAIPISSKVAVKATPALRGLKDFDPKTAYAVPEGNPNGVRLMKKEEKQKEMGIISNLITDMTLRGAPPEEITRAVKHSMVVIDAEKHKLDYKRSERENGIQELKKKWQIRVDEDGNERFGGASTLLSRRKQTVYVPERTGSAHVDPETGNLIYEETLRHRHRDFWQMPCAMGADLSLGDDFCSFDFLFPLENGYFGVKTRDYITSYTLSQLPLAMRQKYEEFMNEGTLQVFDGTVLDMMQVYDDLDAYILQSEYDVRAFGYDPYNAKEFVERWTQENGPFGIEKVIQGARTESVPLGELKKLSEQRKLLFDEALMEFAMGNCITLEDTNGNRKLYKQRHDKKIDAVAALMDAYVAWKLNRDAFE